MSPEINGNVNPPSVTKRKKKKTRSVSNSTSNNALNNGFDGEYEPYDGEAYEIGKDFLNYDCEKSLPPPPGTQPMSLPVYGNNYPRYVRYPSYQVYPPPPPVRHPPFVQPQYPNFMPGPMMGPMPGPMSGLNGPWNRFPPVVMGNSYYQMRCENNDYTSLPPINLNVDESKNRRFSDPGLPNESDCSSNSSFSSVQNYQKVMQEMTSLKENNRKLFKEVTDLRMEVNMLKQSQSSRFYDREYEPGMLADIIREVREAARVREDALLARVKHVFEEKYLGLNDISVANDRDRNSDRISKVEEQLKNLSVISNISNSRSDDSALVPITSPHSVVSTPVNTNEKSKSARQVLELEREALELRRELQDTRARKEEADQKVMQLSKMLQRTERSTSDLLSSCEDGKTSVDSMSTVSTVTTPSSLPPVPPRVILSGPVTDL